MIKFIRRAGRIIPIRSGKVLSKITEASVHKSISDNYLKTLSNRAALTKTEKHAVEIVKNRSARKLELLKKVGMKNEEYKSKLKIAGSGIGLGAIASLMAFGKKKEK